MRREESSSEIYHKMKSSGCKIKETTWLLARSRLWRMNKIYSRSAMWATRWWLNVFDLGICIHRSRSSIWILPEASYAPLGAEWIKKELILGRLLTFCISMNVFQHIRCRIQLNHGLFPQLPASHSHTLQYTMHIYNIVSSAYAHNICTKK